MRIAKTLFLAVGLLGSLLVAAPVFAVENGGVGGRPANPRDDNPRSKSIFVYELEPGQSVNDAVLVVNSTDEKKQIDIYATDALIASGGAFSCEQKADPVDGEGSWIKLDTNAVTLEPYSEKKVGFSMTVPTNVSVGEHNACIAIQSVEEATPSAINGVQLNFRSAIRVAVTIPGDITKSLSFTSLSVKNGKDLLTVNEKLKNNGNVSLDTLLTTSVGTIFGFGKQTIEGEYPIIAGQEAEFNFEFKRPFWGGFYKVNATAQYNNDTSASLGESADKQQKISTSKLIFVAPNTKALLIYGVIILAVVVPLFWRYWAKRKHQTIRAQATSYTVGKNDDINSIAQQFSMTWQTIAKLNGLKPPYALQKGQEILIVVPPDYMPPKAESKKRTSSTKKAEKKTTDKKKKSASKSKSGKNPKKKA